MLMFRGHEMDRVERLRMMLIGAPTLIMIALAIQSLGVFAYFVLFAIAMIAYTFSCTMAYRSFVINKGPHTKRKFCMAVIAPQVLLIAGRYSTLNGQLSENRRLAFRALLSLR